MPQRHVDVLIVGAGIAGLLLARELQERGRRVAIAHDPAHPGAGEAAVGLLNPVRGRRCTLAWRAAESLGVAAKVYGAIGAAAGRAVFRPVPVVRAFASQEERMAWERRSEVAAAAGFASRLLPALPAGLRGGEHGVLEVRGGGAVDPRLVLDILRDVQRRTSVLVVRRCAFEELDFVSSVIRWPAAGVAADRLVLAGGAADLRHPLLGDALLRPVCGESLVIRAPALEPTVAFVCGHHLVPLGAGLWSCGGTKVPGRTSAMPTPEGRAELTDFLGRHLAVPWTLADHRCGVRAATLDTRPVAGAVGADPRIFLFNGLGSQGYALGPWLARVFAAHLADGTALPSELSPGRFVPPAAQPDGTRWHAVDVARAIALRRLAPGDLAIDLTVGNGGDTAWLAGAVGPEGTVLGLDIQPEAIAATRRRLAHMLPDAVIDLRCANHADLASIAPMAWRGRVGAIVANLGYLPGSDSPVVTEAPSTVAAFTAALPLLRAGGVLVAVIYTAHPGAAGELAALERWSASLPPKEFAVEWHRPPDGSARAPMVLSVARLQLSRHQHTQ